jgi:hypothetical protein
MATKHGSPGAGYDPDKDHYHDGLHDDEIREQISSPVHGLRGIADAPGDDRNRNNFYLEKGTERFKNLDTPNADKKAIARVKKTDGDRGNQKAGKL